MKIAFCNRPNYDNPLGGDAVQMLKTKEYLEKLYGLDITVVVSPDDITTDFDLVHVFNFATEDVTAGFVGKAKRLGIRLAASSIYWDYTWTATEFFRRFYYPENLTRRRLGFEAGCMRILSGLIGRPRLISPHFRKFVKYCVESADLILPNSQEEASLLLDFAGLDAQACRDKVRVVNNACEVGHTPGAADFADFSRRYAVPEGYVLQVGRIEYVKNQLNLLYALRDDPEIPVVIVGKIVDPKYYARLKKIADKRTNVYFIEGVPHEDIYMFYKYAAVHALLSLRESPGLVSIEAWASGCPIVVSDKRFCPVDTYFRGHKYVADPLDVGDIREKVLRACREREVPPFCPDEFSWKRAAEQTYEAYRSSI